MAPRLRLILRWIPMIQFGKAWEQIDRWFSGASVDIKPFLLQRQQQQHHEQQQQNAIQC